MQLSLFEEPEHIDPESLTTKVCSKCNQEKALSEFHKKLCAGGYDVKQSYCKDCQSNHGYVIKGLRKTAPPKSSVCDCCGVADSKMILDHDHTTEEFRGWLCYRCNSGIGALGDTTEGLELALSYLRKHDERS